MWKIILLLTVWAVAGAPVDLGKARVFNRNFYGIGTTERIHDSHLQCLLDQRYEFAFLRIFNNGKGDEIGLQNLIMTDNSSLYTELYVTPNPSLSASQQVNDIVEFGKKNGWKFEMLWFEVTDPLKWSNIKGRNVLFINQFVAAAKTHSIALGFFTNWYDYKIITDNSNQIKASDVFYWNTLGIGEKAETVNTVDDFRPFGPFQEAPFAKQYGIDSYVCNMKVTKNVHYGDAVPLKSKRNVVRITGKRR